MEVPEGNTGVGIDFRQLASIVFEECLNFVLVFLAKLLSIVFRDFYSFYSDDHHQGVKVGRVESQQGLVLLECQIALALIFQN